MTYVMAVDDDPEVLETLGRVLQREQYEMRLARSGQEALNFLEERTPDAILMDVMMPGMDGITLCKMVRRDPRFIAVPILFLTAKAGTDDVVDGLDAGADDYVFKPFELAELRARIHALIRRGMRGVPVMTPVIESPTSGKPSQPAPVMTFGVVQPQTPQPRGGAILQMNDLKLDSDTYQAFVGGRRVQLTSTEHRLLRYLMENPNKALSPGHLLQAVWEYPPDTGDPDLVRAHVRNLRAKLEEGTDKRYIRTIHGVGYMIGN